jgi:hypothetical protein
MTDSSKGPSVTELVGTIDEQLRRFDGTRSDLSLREKVICLVEAYKSLKQLGVSMTVQDHGFDAKSAQRRVLLYLQEYPGVAIDGAELEVVSGISEYARRIRELRKEKGYQIASGASPDLESGIDLKPNQYLLVSITRDTDAAERWHVANRIRKDPSGSKQRVLMFLQENVGRIVTTEELAYVARDAKEYARRTRELRTEDGYAVATRFTGRPDLNVGQYVLESSDRVAEPHDRKIPEKIQKIVYERDSHGCRLCGWDREKWTKENPRILELHHIENHVDGGQNVASNLIVLCSRCHDEVHAGRMDLPMTEG